MSIAIPPAPTRVQRPARRPRRATIDAVGGALPATAFFISAVSWLVVSGGLALLASIKLHMPEFFANSAWLAYGRVRPAHVTTALYGWASMAAIGTLLRMQARLCGVRLPFPNLLLGSCVLWNCFVAAGTISILRGYATGVSWLEMPRIWALVGGAALCPVLFVTLVMLAGRRRHRLDVPQWYLLVAAVWFSFIFLMIGSIGIGRRVPGMPGAAASAWFGHNLAALWLTPVALAVAYELIPRIVARPVYSNGLAIIGFWALVVVCPWGGTQKLVGGPLPHWVQTMGVIIPLLALIPAMAVSANLYMTVRGRLGALRTSVPLRLVAVGVACYLAASLQVVLHVLQPARNVVQLTHCGVAHTHLGLYAFVTMVMFGALIDGLGPRRAYARHLAEVVFWSVTVGIVLYWLGLMIGGVVQGLRLNDADAPFVESTAASIACLGARSAAAYALVVGHLALVWLLLQAWLARQERNADTAGGVA